MKPLYPKVKVKLTGIDGNAFMILGVAQRAAKEAGLKKEITDKYFEEATSGDYDHLLQTTMKYFDVR